MFTQEELTVMHDRMADILCYLAGVEAGILSNPNGNQKQRNAMLNLCAFINARATDQKLAIKRKMK